MHSEGHEIIDKEIRVGKWIKCRELMSLVESELCDKKERRRKEGWTFHTEVQFWMKKKRRTKSDIGNSLYHVPF